MKYPLRRRLKAMTLVEIMVVTAIMSLLAVVMVPTVKFQYRNRSVKEGARQLNASSLHSSRYTLALVYVI